MALVSLPGPNTRISLATRIGESVESFKAALRQRRMFRTTINELSALSDRELNDLGLCRSMIQDVARNSVYN